MEVLDATSLEKRLQWEATGYWLHMEADTPLEKYPAKQHARRVQEKLGVEDGLIYLVGQKLRIIEDNDMPVPFRQRRYFYYMSGCNEPDCHLTYDVQHDRLTLFIARTEERRAVYYGPGMTPAIALDKFDVDEVHYDDQLPGFINDWLHHGGNRGDLYALHESQIPKLPKKFRELRSVDTTALQPAMDLARVIKDDHEIELIRKANDISSQAHREVLAKISEFQNEAQVEGLFRDVCISHQAKQQAYDPIAASGPNAGILHYDANDEDLAGRQLMCLDAGCEYQLYASDITRTFPLAGEWPSKEAHDIYKLVERMQEACIERVAPGVRYLDLHILAHQIAIDGLLTLGILHNGSKEEIYKAGTSKAFFLHGLGHHVGLEVHDVGQAELMSMGKVKTSQTPSLYPEGYHVPVYDPKTCFAPTDPQSSHLEEGMVVTIEPGIYFSVYALNHLFLPSPIHSKYINAEVLKRYLPVGGVRIEDDILVTSRGYENLTTAPKGDAMLQIIRSRRSNADRPLRKRNSGPRRNSNEEPLLQRAPGILCKEPVSILKPISRAATMPPESKLRSSVDFERYQGPSLFSNFKRAMTTEERVHYWQQNQRKASGEEQVHMPRSQTLCGESSPHFMHIYTSTNPGVPPCSPSPSTYSRNPCQKCSMLCQTLDRLRGHLNRTEPSKAETKMRPHFATMTRAAERVDPTKLAVKSDIQVPLVPPPKDEYRGYATLPFRNKASPTLPQLRNRHSVASFAPQSTVISSRDIITPIQNLAPQRMELPEAGRRKGLRTSTTRTGPLLHKPEYGTSTETHDAGESSLRHSNRALPKSGPAQPLVSFGASKKGCVTDPNDSKICATCRERGRGIRCCHLPNQVSPVFMHVPYDATQDNETLSRL